MAGAVPRRRHGAAGAAAERFGFSVYRAFNPKPWGLDPINRVYDLGLAFLCSLGSGYIKVLSISM